MPIYPARFLPNPIPFALHLSSKAPISLPLLSRAQVPGPSVVVPKLKSQMREEFLSHNPVKLLAEARDSAKEQQLFDGKGPDFPRNLRIESLVDEPTYKAKFHPRIRRQIARAVDKRS